MGREEACSRGDSRGSRCYRSRLRQIGCSGCRQRRGDDGVQPDNKRVELERSRWKLRCRQRVGFRKSAAWTVRVSLVDVSGVGGAVLVGEAGGSYSDELRERAARYVFESKRPIAHVAEDLGIHKEAPRRWVRQAEAEAGERTDLLRTSERCQPSPHRMVTSLEARPCRTNNSVVDGCYLEG